ncbi:LPO_1073/Vpar_1526 family protein [Hymenobacter cheonanensis]|uniref:LPO_1073/Vpar_1526 family protein n=1 Tax=Hymenobacter sp. CA2-7 TaxID=3063993 RepID=UPI002714187F|nr:LPO_1073/Vpar_1526 family protein [Hymenobacter sp. CA2-7]MDO7888179.1 hypothetical protein [Hymenobacter sp. CA2-7]
MNNKDFTQLGAEGSENYQAANNITINKIGLSFAEAKDLIMLVMEQNFIKFSEQALATARIRAEEMTTDYLNGLAARNPALVEAVQQPGIQMAIVAAQKEYIKTGDKFLAELLVNTLIERTNQPQRTVLQIALDESLSIIGKLTNNQINMIVLSFAVLSVTVVGINSLESFKSMCDSDIKPLVEILRIGGSDLAHIVGCNCGLLLPKKQDYLVDWQRRYKGLFSKGFTQKEIEDILEMTFTSVNTQCPGLFVNCLHDKDKIQIGYMDEDVFEKNIVEFSISQETKIRIKTLFLGNVMSTGEMQIYLSTFGDYMEKLFAMMHQGTLALLVLNAVGQTIAVTAYGKILNKSLDYKLWIPD